MAFSTLSVDFTARLAGFEEGINKASRDVDKLGSRVGSVASGIKSTFASLGIGLGVGAFAGVIKSAIDAQDELAKMSQKTGIAVETMAGLQHAADLSGVEVDQLAKGVRSFSVLVDEAASGQKSYQDKLVSLGLNYKQLKDLSPEQQFYALADAVSKLGEQDRAAAVSGALGDRMAVLVPLLSGGAEEMRKLVEEGQRLNPVTAESARKAEEFNDNLDRLKKEAGLAGIELSTNLIPSLADTSTEMAKLAREGHGVLALMRGFAGIGKIPWDILIGDIEPARTAKERIQELREELGSLDRKSKSGNGKLLQAIFGTPEEIQQQMTVIRNQIAALEKFGDKIYTPKQPASGGGADTAAAQRECILNGGVWDGKKCRPKPTGSGSKTDPLAGIIKQTDTARAQEYEKLLGMLDARFQSGRRNAQQYQEAVAVLNKQFGREAIDPLGSGSFSTTSRDVAEFIRQQQEAVNGLNGEMAQDGVRAAQEYQSALESLLSDTTLAKTDRLQANIDLIDKAFFDGVIGVAQYDEAIAKLTSGASSELKETKSIAEDLGLTFTSAFEDAVVGGEKFSDVLKGLERDIARIITRKTVTEPFGNAVSSMISSGFSNGFGNGQNLFGDIASLFGFASGGSFTVGGSGGTDSQLVAFRATPGEMVDVRTPGQAAGGGGVSIVQHINIDSRSDQASILAAMAQARDAAVAAVESSMRRGGTMAKLTAA